MPNSYFVKARKKGGSYSRQLLLVSGLPLWKFGEVQGVLGIGNHFKAEIGKAESGHSKSRKAKIKSVLGQDFNRCDNGFSATPAAHSLAINSPSNVASFNPCRFAKVTRCASVVSL
jgi:hypothetical protein